MSEAQEIAEAIAAAGPLFEEPMNAATGETAEEAAAAVAEAVAAVEGEGKSEEAAEAPPKEPPKDDPVTKRLAIVAREKARLEAERARVKAERAAIDEARREVEEYRARKAKSAEDPFAFLKAETGLEFEDLARSLIAKAEPPKEPDPLEEVRRVREELEQLRQERVRLEQQQQYEAAVREIKSQTASKAPELAPELARVMQDPASLRSLQALGFGDPADRVVEMVAEVWRHGGEAVIDGKHYVWPKGTDLPVDVAVRAVDNVLMQLLAPLRGSSGTEAKPTAQPKAAALAEKTPPGESAKKPRTLSNTRASTPTSPVRESRTYASEEDEVRDLARRFNVWE